MLQSGDSAAQKQTIDIGTERLGWVYSYLCPWGRAC